VTALARAAGIGGMVGGQMLDLAAEGRFEAKPAPVTEQRVRILQAMKTGALLRFACTAGAILGKADASQWDALERYGSALGEAFQIADDLLDVEGFGNGRQGDRQDAAAHKATLVGVLGPTPAAATGFWWARRKRRSRSWEQRRNAQGGCAFRCCPQGMSSLALRQIHKASCTPARTPSEDRRRAPRN
jgi:geranylgeranyl pyrophosphate synthase